VILPRHLEAARRPRLSRPELRQGPRGFYGTGNFRF
jgi:hypothetical protein